MNRCDNCSCSSEELKRNGGKCPFPVLFDAVESANLEHAGDDEEMDRLWIGLRNAVAITAACALAAFGGCELVRGVLL